MIYKYSKKELKNALSVGAKFSSGSKVMQILECVCVNIDEKGKTTIMSTDLENSIYSITNAIENPGTPSQFCVNGSDFEKCVSLISDDFVTIEFNDGDSSVKILHEKGETEMPVFPFDEFPKTKSDGESVMFSVSAHDLLKAVSDGQKFVATDDSRPNLKSLFFKVVEGGKIELCSTDAHTLFNDSMKYESESEVSGVEFMVSSKAFQSIVNICNCEIKANGEMARVRIKSYHDNVLFSIDSCKLVSQKVEGRFPNYSAVIQNLNAHDITAEVSVNELAMSIKRVGISAPLNGLVRFGLSTDGKMTVSSTNVDFGKKSSDSIKCASSGDIEIGVSMGLATRCLSVITTDTVKMRMKNASSAIVFDDDENPGRIVMLMPLML